MVINGLNGPRGLPQPDDFQVPLSERQFNRLPLNEKLRNLKFYNSDDLTKALYWEKNIRDVNGLIESTYIEPELLKILQKIDGNLIALLRVLKNENIIFSDSSSPLTYAIHEDAYGSLTGRIVKMQEAKNPLRASWVFKMLVETYVDGMEKGNLSVENLKELSLEALRTYGEPFNFSGFKKLVIERINNPSPPSKNDPFSFDLT
ncbi:MAG: hypothetical protein QNJ31_05965 [Candidatus Caenarcaniphilales bacterium]|nr:hypothetical protein [Candidatus Caenarcaniphilales bacterium]